MARPKKTPPTPPTSPTETTETTEPAETDLHPNLEAALRVIAGAVARLVTQPVEQVKPQAGQDADSGDKT